MNSIQFSICFFVGLVMLILLVLFYDPSLYGLGAIALYIIFGGVQLDRMQENEKIRKRDDV